MLHTNANLGMQMLMLVAILSLLLIHELMLMTQNRFMTDLRTGAAGAVALKHLGSKATGHDCIGFIGCGAIAKNMARAAASIRNYKGVAFAPPGNCCSSFLFLLFLVTLP